MFPQEVINYLRNASHSSTYAPSMPAPVAQQVISSMSIITGEDGSNEGMRTPGKLGRPPFANLVSLEYSP